MIAVSHGAIAIYIGILVIVALLISGWLWVRRTIDEDFRYMREAAQHSTWLANEWEMPRIVKAIYDWTEGGELD